MVVFRNDEKMVKNESGFIQASLCKIQGLLKDFPTVFKD